MDKIKAVLFDMDGTLVDSYDAWFEAFNSALVHFGFSKIERQEFSENIWAISFGISIKKYLPGITSGKIQEYYFDTFQNFICLIRLNNNVLEILEYFKSKNIKLAVVSNTQANIIKKILSKLKILQYFDFIIGGDSVKTGKPNPEIIKLACKSLSVLETETIFVGDTIFDKKAAISAGSNFIGYNFGDITDLVELKGYLKC
ncbi:MAG: HAD family hydrolase [Nanoarchaeota archaeon]